MIDTDSFTLEASKSHVAIISVMLNTDSDETHWRLKAACMYADDPDIFFVPSAQNEALEYCAICPVTAECLAFAESLDRDGLVLGPHGIWGGITAKERGKLRSVK